MPMCTFVCKFGCCTRQYCPLTVAYARTFHKFQGLQAGPVGKNQQPNMFDVIICNPDEKCYKSKNLGLFYTGLSRATTYGDDDGKDSAIYFTGSEFTADRFRRLSKKPNSNEDFELVKTRKQWVQYLKQRAEISMDIIQPIINDSESICNWIKNFKISKYDLQERIDLYKTTKYIPM
jgi:hypothetical protein